VGREWQLLHPSQCTQSVNDTLVSISSLELYAIRNTEQSVMRVCLPSTTLGTDCSCYNVKSRVKLVWIRVRMRVVLSSYLCIGKNVTPDKDSPTVRAAGTSRILLNSVSTDCIHRARDPPSHTYGTILSRVTWCHECLLSWFSSAYQSKAGLVRQK
jgi:hypothetical protein